MVKRGLKQKGKWKKKRKKGFNKEGKGTIG